MTSCRLKGFAEPRYEIVDFTTCTDKTKTSCPWLATSRCRRQRVSTLLLVFLNKIALILGERFASLFNWSDNDNFTPKGVSLTSLLFLFCFYLLSQDLA